jgi:hypothetical protein
MTTENAQLSLIDTPRSWRLDERTRAVGREGIARARAALREGRHVRSQDPPSTGARRPAARRRRPDPPHRAAA